MSVVVETPAGLPTIGMSLSAAAARYAELLGWPVLQLVEEGKVPVTARGLTDATTDARAVAALWRRRPRANIGIRVPEGIVVVDVDGPAGVEALRSAGSIPHTLTAATGRGWHLWFTAPEGIELRQRAGLLRRVDTRTAGKGYLVAPPSVHETGVVYSWVRRLEPAPLPAWLVDLLRVRAPVSAPYVAPPPPIVSGRRARYAAAVLVGEAREVAASAEGGRNDRLNRAWFRCAQFRDVLPREVAERELTAGATAAGLPEPEIRRVLR